MENRCLNPQIFERLPECVCHCFSDGKVADYISVLANVPNDKFGVTARFLDGQTYSTGDANGINLPG